MEPTIIRAPSTMSQMNGASLDQNEAITGGDLE